MDPNATFTDLIGYLRQFYKKLGYDEIRIRPGYFPYVEPGLEVDVFHPKKKKWVELGGAGILRPEVVIPLLGKYIPVLAWGQGLERGISEYYNITDIRELYKNNLKQLSMGMSDDYVEAVILNSTYIRLGTILFGERKWIIK